MAWADLNSLHNPATGTSPPATWGDQVRDNFQFLAGTDGATVATSETETSTSYDDLATVGPAVTVTTGTRVLVTFGALFYNSGANLTWLSFAVSGATTLAAADARAISHASTSGFYLSRTMELTALTAGSNTFTLKYKVGAGTGTYQDRDIVVTPLT
jgi:hypothetical protein